MTRKVTKVPAWLVTATVEFVVEQSDAPTKAKVREVLKGEAVKVKSGLLDNRVMGTVKSIRQVETSEVEYTEGAP